jgi:hypothetical protein
LALTSYLLVVEEILVGQTVGSSSLQHWWTEMANQRGGGGSEWEPIKIHLQELDFWAKVTSKDHYTNLLRSRSHNGPTDPKNKLEQA